MRTKLWTFALLSLFFTACSKDDTTDNTPADGSVAAEINASITDAIVTRVSGMEWDKGDCIGISEDQFNHTNVPHTFDGQSFQPQGTAIYFKGPETATFSAYYPYNNAGGILTVTTDAENQNPQIDFLFATGVTADIQNPQVNFTNKNAAGETDPTKDHSFYHCMSQISLTFKEGVEVDFETEGITDFTFTNLKLNGTFNTATGEAQADEGAAVSPLTIDLSGATVTDGKVSSSVICLPQEVAEIQLSVTVNGIDYQTTLSLPDADQDGTPDNSLMPGYNYTYNIIVDKTGIVPGECTIESWNDTGNYQGEASNMGYYYDKETHTCIVYNENGLEAWAKAAQNDMTLNCTIVNTITLPEVPDGESNWTPIGSEDNPYQGQFAGEFSINNVTIDLPEEDYVGMFRALHKDSHVEIILQNAKIVGRNYVGAIAGSNNGNILCLVMGSVTGAQYVGGYTGTNGNVVEMRSGNGLDYNLKLRVSGTDYVGGITGYHTNNSGLKYSRNVNTGENIPVDVSGNQYVGGVVGYSTDTLRNIHAELGTVFGNKEVGGIVGHSESAVLGSYCGYTVKSDNGSYIGGISGMADGDIIGCHTSGDVSGKECVGGIVGQNNIPSSKLYSCYTMGAVSGDISVGSITGHNLCKVLNCYYTQGDTGIGLDEGVDTYEVYKITDYSDSGWALITRKMNSAIPTWEKFKIEYTNTIPPVVTYRHR